MKKERAEEEPRKVDYSAIAPRMEVFRAPRFRPKLPNGSIDIEKDIELVLKGQRKLEMERRYLEGLVRRYQKIHSIDGTGIPSLVDRFACNEDKKKFCPLCEEARAFLGGGELNADGVLIGFERKRAPKK